jgi:hypothetical protein
MPMLADLAEEMSARDADQLDAATRLLGRIQRAVETQQELGLDTVETARFVTGYALTRLNLVEYLWESALSALRKKLTGAEAERVIRTHLHMFESGQQLVRVIRPLWTLVEKRGGAPEQLDDLDRAERRFEELAAEAQAALEHRTRPWQSTDPVSLAQGLQLAREGKTMKADEARAWFRQPRG